MEEVGFMIPLYILGLLLRFGPQHGYQIKKMIEEQLADFTQIKLPTIYYHLDKLEAACFVYSQTDQEGTRPEKKVYGISENGINEFKTLLNRELNIQYRPTFNADALFYFSDHISEPELLEGLNSHLEQLQQSLKRIDEHRSFTVSLLPDEMKPYADIIFEHHVLHYQAEIMWTEKSIQNINI